MKNIFKKILNFFTNKIKIHRSTKLLYVTNIPVYGMCVLKYNKQEDAYDVYDDYKNYLCSIPWDSHDDMDVDMIKNEIVKKLLLDEQHI